MNEAPFAYLAHKFNISHLYTFEKCLLEIQLAYLQFTDERTTRRDKVICRDRTLREVTRQNRLYNQAYDYDKWDKFDVDAECDKLDAGRSLLCLEIRKCSSLTSVVRK